MPGPEDVVIGIFDSNNSITLLNSILVHTERDVSVAYIVIFYIGNQIHCILPYQFGFNGSTISILAYVRVGNCIACMVNEITKNIGPGWCRRNICGKVSCTIFDGVSIYQRERIVSRSSDNVAVGSILVYHTAIGLVGEIEWYILCAFLCSIL